MSKNIPKDAIRPVVAYLIVAWNNNDIVDECIESIDKQTGVEKKIIFVDNNSADDTVEYVKQNHPHVDVMAQSKNYGFAKGNNIAIQRALEDATVEYLVLLNTDARLAPNWTATLVTAAQKKPRAATLQSITLDYYDHGIIDSTHVYISRIGQGTQGSFREPIAYGYDIASQKVYGCNAAAMMITRKFVEAQPFRDFFDETMFMYLEDVDVATRATIMGWDNYVVSGTQAYHMGSASSGKNPGFSLYMTFRNNTGLLIKNLPGLLLFRILIGMPKADLAAIRHLRRIGKPEGVKPLLKGRLVSLRFIPIFIYKRHQLAKLRTVDPQYLWHLMRRGY